MTGTVEPSLTPDLRDPRVTVAVPREYRAALATLWALAERLTKLLHDSREPLIGQIKLAWWRDMLALLASDPAALPKGEPLLAELQASWAGQGGLGALADAAEAMLLAESDEARSEEHTSELQSLMRTSYAVFCLKKKKNTTRPISPLTYLCNLSHN